MPSEEGRGPKLGLDWEESVYRGLRALWRGLRPGRPSQESLASASLGPLETRLTVVAQTLTGDPVRVRPASAEGGVVGMSIYVPQIIDLAATKEANERLYVARTAMGASLYRLGPTDVLPASTEARVALELERVERALAWLITELAGFQALWSWACRLALLSIERHPPASNEEARLRLGAMALLSVGASSVEVAPDVAIGTGRPRLSPTAILWGTLFCSDPSIVDEKPAPNEANAPARGASQHKMKTVESTQRVELDQQELEDATLQHSFEKIETADEYHGGARDLDGTDQVDEHAEAFEEIRFGRVTRSDEIVHAVLAAEVGSGGDIPDVEHISPSERGIHYDEWDHKKRGYKEDFCTVYPTRVQKSDLAWHLEPLHRNRLLVDDLRRIILARRMRRAPVRRQLDGEWIDIDAVIYHLAAKRASECSSPRFYVRRTRANPDVATLVLLDVSLSSDSWVEGRRVLDVAREAVLVLGEVTSSLKEPLGIFAFASHTRNRCRVFEISGRTTPWPTARARLGALVPQGYTRIGPALRHATEHLCAEDAKHRLLLLVSDGKPTDYDRYEGSYGIADVRQAVREAQAKGVVVHGLAIDARAHATLPAMLGQGRFHLLSHLADLPRALTTIYASFAG